MRALALGAVTVSRGIQAISSYSRSRTAIWRENLWWRLPVHFARNSLQRGDQEIYMIGVRSGRIYRVGRCRQLSYCRLRHQIGRYATRSYRTLGSCGDTVTTSYNSCPIARWVASYASDGPQLKSASPPRVVHQSVGRPFTRISAC